LKHSNINGTSENKFVIVTSRVKNEGNPSKRW